MGSACSARARCDEGLELWPQPCPPALGVLQGKPAPVNSSGGLAVSTLPCPQEGSEKHFGGGLSLLAEQRPSPVSSALKSSGGAAAAPPSPGRAPRVPRVASHLRGCRVALKGLQMQSPACCFLATGALPLSWLKSCPCCVVLEGEHPTAAPHAPSQCGSGSFGTHLQTAPAVPRSILGAWSPVLSHQKNGFIPPGSCPSAAAARSTGTQREQRSAPRLFGAASPSRWCSQQLSRDIFLPARSRPPF